MPDYQPTLRPVLQVHDLSFAYDTQPPLFDHWNASIGPGVTLLHGDTGTGKSTLLQVLSGRLAASGRLVFSSKASEPVDLAKQPDAYRRNVFLADRTSDAFDRVTARECTAALSAADTNFNDAEWRVLVDGFALAPHIDKPMYMLSTGSKHKVWLAAALASGRALVLLDEPTGGLDSASIACLRSALTRQAERTDRAVVITAYETIESVPLAASIALPLAAFPLGSQSAGTLASDPFRHEDDR